MTTIKICGLQTVEHALTAAQWADWLGLVFAPSRRQVTVAQAVSIVQAVRQHDPESCVRFVGLFVHASVVSINEIVRTCQLDYVQLAGDETLAQAEGICCPVIKVIRMRDDPNEQAWLALMHANPPSLPLATCPYIIDADQAGRYGGTGKLADWQRAAMLAQRARITLAGGLTPENVAAAIMQVRPWGVDVSSGVEIDGMKDHQRIVAFAMAVRAVENCLEVA
ncbi:MAG: phosphoribosylanthranilate isomerase [Chloroflexaceae bacterium]|nr:phosphoribosylanthranilate isomerase [Chloroflexaceae bacterium]